MEEFVLHTLSNVGVPAAVCFYTLFALNKNVERLCNLIERLDMNWKERLGRLELAVSELRKEIHYEKRN